MASIHPVTIPKWGIEMQEGTVTEWRAQVGDAVEKGQELIDIESDKIVNTMEAPASGTLRRILAQVDETLKVGQLIGVIADADASEAEVDAFIEAFVPADAGFGIGEDSEEAPAEPSAPAAEPEPAAAQAATTGEVKISPVARRLADKLGVDITRVQGTGRHGRISTQDVEAAAAQRGAGEEPADAEPDQGAQADGQPLSGRALAAARRLVESKQTIPHFYLHRDLDMRAALDAKARAGVPLTALLVRALADALQARPGVNAHLIDEVLYPQRQLSVNVAVDTPEGLVAPLLADIGAAGPEAIAQRLEALAGRARDRALGREDLAPGGITLSNLGMFGITGFSAIINPPQVAILAVGTVRPVVLEQGGEPVPAMSATLSCDHRAIDGATGARFLAALQEALDAL